MKDEGISNNVISSWSADILVTNERYKTTGKLVTTQKSLEARSQGWNGVHHGNISLKLYGQKRLKHYILKFKITSVQVKGSTWYKSSIDSIILNTKRSSHWFHCSIEIIHSLSSSLWKTNCWYNRPGNWEDWAGMLRQHNPELSAQGLVQFFSRAW